MFVKNYKSLSNVKIDFDFLTIFMGKNNSGKSNIVKCIETAFSYTNAEKEDIYCSPDSMFDLEKEAIIDILIIPTNDNNEYIDSFNDVWGRKFGDAISIDDSSDKEFFAFRTIISYDTDKEIFINQKYKIDQWNEDGNHTVGTILKRETINGIEVVSIPAQRDISHDIRDRKSIWGRLVSKIKITSEVEERIEAQLSQLNKDIIRESDLLQSIATELKRTTGEKTSTVEITPITKNVDSLYKGMDIIYTDESSLPTSVENLGLGVRSWAVFSTVKAEILAKIEKAQQDEYAYFPLVLIEEPEAHVHPQAQRQLFSMLLETPAQKIITTHSPYILSQTDLDCIRNIRKPQSYSEVVPLLTEGLTKEEIRKIKRTVMNTRGEPFPKK